MLGQLDLPKLDSRKMEFRYKAFLSDKSTL